MAFDFNRLRMAPSKVKAVTATFTKTFVSVRQDSWCMIIVMLEGEEREEMEH